MVFIHEDRELGSQRLIVSLNHPVELGIVRSGSRFVFAKISRISLTSSDSKLQPWSECNSNGVQNLHTDSCTRTVATVLAFCVGFTRILSSHTGHCPCLLRRPTCIGFRPFGKIVYRCQEIFNSLLCNRQSAHDIHSNSSIGASTLYNFKRPFDAVPTSKNIHRNFRTIALHQSDC